MEVPPSLIKMRLKSAPQKVNFLLAKGIQKCYILNCSHKCPCTFPHSCALLRHLVFKKNHFMSNKQHFLQYTISFIIFWDFPMFNQIFLSPYVKRCAIITYKHGIYESPHELPNDLENYGISGNCPNFKEW